MRDHEVRGKKEEGRRRREGGGGGGGGGERRGGSHERRSEKGERGEKRPVACVVHVVCVWAYGSLAVDTSKGFSRTRV
jgi:hypothetical protein